MERLEDWKKETGEIPENTCPDIDKAQKELKNLESEMNFLQKNLHRYETVEDIAKDLPDVWWLDTPSILENLRKDNEQLRELGKFWYEKTEEVLIELENLKDWVKIHGFTQD